MRIGFLVLTLALLAAGAANAGEMAADDGMAGRHGARPDASVGQRPPADASPEERRAYWQKRAAERAAVAQGDAVPDQGRVAPALNRRPATGCRPPAGQGDSEAGRARDGMLWLTDAPLARGGRPGGWRGASGGMSEMSAMGGGDMPKKRVWLRMGGNPLKARPVAGADDDAAMMQDPEGGMWKLEAESNGGPYGVAFPTPTEGYYNVYLVRREVDHGVLKVNAAKTEVLRTSMGHGMSKEEAARLMMARTDFRVPVELVRERREKEELFTRVNYGDAIAFRVFRDGRPVPNARVTFTSGRGWSNSVQSDADGRAVFTVIRDYYPESWHLFDKRHRETYLVAASFAVPDGGDDQGARYESTRYLATLSGAYYPGVADYESYASGLMIGMTGLLFTGTGVWLYRRRRVKPFREVRFDE